MSPENVFEVNQYEIFLCIALWIVSIILLWRIFVDEDWPGCAALIPIFDLFVLGTIIAKAGWWGLKNTLKEVIIITVLTVACLIFIPAIVEGIPSLSALIKLMPPSIIGGYLISRKLGYHSYNLYIPAAAVVFSVVAIMGITILLLVLAMKSLGAEGVHKLVSGTVPGIRDVDADILLTILNMGIYILVLMVIASVRSLFVCGVIGAWIGEKIRRQFSQAGPKEDFIRIDNRIPSKPLIDTRISDNSPVRFHSQNSVKEPGTVQKPPEEMTILDKLKA